MSERLDPPEPPCLPDFDTLGDQQHDREVEEGLWNRPRLVRAACPYCSTLGCPACAHVGIVTRESER